MNKLLSGRYRILGIIGYGGMAVVYRAMDELKNKEVAIKVLRPEYEEDANFVRRFDREAVAASKVQHDNIVRMYDVGSEEKKRYIVMELVNGTTLKEIIRRERRIPAQTAVRYALRILAALDHAHKNGIIHRDIKPQNILVDRNGTIKVADFGIARITDQATGTLTDMTIAMGSVHYLSPEQAEGRQGVDARSDLYSVGIVLYEMLTGDVPFNDDNAVAIAVKHINEQPKSMRLLHRDISKGLDEVIMKALSKEPEQRYQTASEMAADLKKALRMPGGGFVSGLLDDENREENTASALIRYLKKHGVSTLIAGIACIAVMATVAVGAVKVSDILYGVDVPNVTGYTRDIAEVMLNNYELDAYVEEEYNSEIPSGQVIRQEPGANERGRRNDVVVLYVSLGAQPIPLPDTVGYAYPLALSMLADYGFDKVLVEYDAVPQKSVDIVLEQTPNDGYAQEGQIVRLKVNSNKVLVPQLDGLTIAEAKDKLQEQGLELGNITSGYTLDDMPDTVITQNPQANSEVIKGTSVDIHIALASPKTYYASYTLHVPLTMNVRIVQTTPGGYSKDVYNADVQADKHLILDLSSEESGGHKIDVYFDGEWSFTEEIQFK